MRIPFLILLALAASAVQPPPAVAPQVAYAEPSIAPDGSDIAFVSGGDIWTVPAAGGQARLLISNAANDTHPVWSPDKTRLAFVSTRTGGGDIYVLTLASGDVSRVTYDDGIEQLDGWSRDGKWLYFFCNAHELAGGVNDVYRVLASGGTPMPVSADRYANEFFAAESPDGKRIAMSARGNASGQWWRHGHSHLDEADLWVRDLAAPDAPASYRVLTTGGAKNLWPMWRDDSSLYYVSDSSGAENIWQTALDARQPRQVTHFTDGRVLWPSATARADTIVFERNFRIWKVDTASGNAAEVPITRVGAPSGPAVDHVRATSDFSDLALSPDGKKVAFAARGEIFAASAKDGGDAVRVTSTPGAETNPVWSPDSRRLVYSSERDGDARLYLYDFAGGRETPLTAGSRDYAPRFSPDGKTLAFVRGGTELHVLDMETKKERMLAKGAIADLVQVGHPLAWSPDGKWIAFFTAGLRGFTNVSIVPAAGGDAKPVSFLANANANTVAWSPDGTFILFDTSQRTEQGQMARVELLLKTPKFREDQFRDLFTEEQGPKRPGEPSSPPPAEAPPKPPRAEDVTAKPASPSAAPLKADVKIVFDGIRQRLSLLPTGLDVGEGVVSPDGKTLVMIAGAAGQQNLYSWSLDETARERPVARQITATSGSKADVCFTPDSKELYYLDAGRIQTVALDKREPKPVSVTAELDVDFSTEKMAAFDQAWRLLRDNFFDPSFNGVDWAKARAGVEPYIAGSRTPDEWRRVASLMIGELNASHMGISAPPSGAGGGGVGHLGVDFDRAEYEKTGALKITHVIPLGPAALAGLAVNDVVYSVGGTRVDRTVNLDALLQNTTEKRVVLGIVTPAHAVVTTPHDVAVRPITAATERGLRYREWVEQRRAYVATISHGRLGYVHMPDMGAASLAQLFVDLDADNIGRDGVVIDVRNNNGGFVNAYALDVFSRQHYMNMTQRGLPTSPARSALGQRSLEKPTVLVTNQHSLSDAEDFTEGYRAMHLGKVVGEPTAGWIIYTWNTRLLDGTVLRLPRSRITDARGEPMEMHPRPVDVEVTRPIGESYGERDSQLDKAVEVLLGQMK